MARPEWNTPASFLRRVAATLMCLAGTGQVAALWFRELTGAAVADALAGFLYLVIGIGLFGKSRLSLFLGMLIPAAAITLIAYTGLQSEQPYRLHIAADGIVFLFCAIELWRVRHNISA